MSDQNKNKGFIIGFWVYIQSEPNLYTVGFYSPDGKWNTDSDWPTKSEASLKVSFLNGSLGQGRFITDQDIEDEMNRRGITGTITRMCGRTMGRWVRNYLLGWL
jgi:hypothetical protein